LATPPKEKIVLYVGDRFFFWFNTNARQRPGIPSRDAGSRQESSRNCLAGSSDHITRERLRASLRRTRLEDASNAGTSLDLARCPWYLRLMIRSVRIVNRKHMACCCWAVEGVVR
jgi:hypothetical protein